MEVAVARATGAVSDAPVETTQGDPPGADPRVKAAVGVLGVVVVALAVAAGWLGVSAWQTQDKIHQRDAAEQAARQTAVNLASIDYRTVNQGIDRVLSGMTGEVKSQWATQSKTIADTATKSQSMSTVQSVRAGVVSIDGDSAEVVVAVSAVTTSPKVRQGAPRYYRFTMDLTRTDGRWLVSKLGLVP
jgi:Mce-associated membrane protein